MSTLVLLVYVIGVLWFCLATLNSDEKKKTGLDWFFAIALPLGSTLGTLGFVWGGDERWPALAYLPFFMLGIVGIVWEARDLRTVEGGFSIINIVAAIVLLGLIFGIGLFLGGIWLRRAI